MQLRKGGLHMPAAAATGKTLIPFYGDCSDLLGLQNGAGADMPDPS